MKNIFTALFFLLILSLHQNLFSQVRSINTVNILSKPKFKSSKPPKQLNVSKESIKEMLKQDSIEATYGAPFRFGKSVSVDIDFIQQSSKNYSGDTLYYNYEIQSKKAFSINLIFDKAILSKTAYINIYNSDKSFKYGPITQNDISENSVFWTDLIKGDHINIELIEPNPNGVNVLHISKVIHGYKNTFTPNNFGDSFSCNVDINCPQGDNWHNEADAVAMILLDAATRWCTGSLINNTARDFKGFFLTAFHCVDISGDGTLSSAEKSSVTNWLFRFKYESPTCGGVDGTSYITFNGANFKAAYQPSDMTLLELSTSPSIADCIRYAGWTKSSSSASSGTGIHHPRGDVKKISFDYNALTSNSSTINWSGGTTSPSNTHWVVGYDLGTAEGGSSGSPLFDQNHRIVGQLHGGANGCAPVTKYYGRLDVSWNGGGTNDTRLSNWLDPINSGVTTMNTEVPAFIQGPPQFCTSQTYSISNLPAGTAVSWSTTGSISISGANNLNSVTVIKNSVGYGTLNVVINSSCGSISLTPITVYAGSKPPDEIFGYYDKIHKRIYAYVTSQPGETYNWYVDGTFRINTTGLALLPIDNNICGVIHGVDVEAISACGTSTKTSRLFEIGPCDNFLTVHINPTNNELNVSYIREKTGEENIKSESPTSSVKDIILLNDKGETLRSGKIKSGENSTVLDIKDIPDGIYFLHIIMGKEVLKKQIVIKY